MSSEKPSPPIADKRPFKVASPHGTRTDEYHWLRDDHRQDPDVLGYLTAENDYTRTVLAPVKELENHLFEEIVGRIQQDDSSVPVLDDGYWYYTRYETGKQYPIHARRKGEMTAPEEILLDSNQLAEGHDFYQIASLKVSPSNDLLAYAEDTVGRRKYVIRIKDLRTGETLPDAIRNTSGSLTWAGDDSALIYVERDATTLLPYLIKKHVVSRSSDQPGGEDVVIYQEKDNTFYAMVHQSRSKEFLFITLRSTVSTEVRYARADDPELKFQTIMPRQRDHEYNLEHLGDHFVIRTNHQARNFRIVEARVGEHEDRDSWRDVIAHRDDVFIHGFDVFEKFLAVSLREGGLRKILLHPTNDDGSEDTYIDADEPTYTAHLGYTPDPASAVIRYVYTSLTTPPTTYDHDISTGEKTLRKREPVLGDFDPAHHVTEFVHARSRDGVDIPISLVYRRDTAIDGTAPLYLYAYGSYGLTRDPAFSSVRLSLLDRGFVYAIAHVRGGQALGRPWYETGRLLDKKNTFFDFIDATEHLVREGYGARDKVFACGGSAGGLLMGAVANMRPDLYRAIIAHVPFVDVVTTMLDEDLPLTTGEYDEWGNPNDKEFYDYILSYSPYDNVSAQDYPAMLVTTGLWDSQVQYFEPAKWVARLRDRKTDDNPLLLHTNMEAGHGGNSGRYERYREIAMEYAFVLQQLGVTE